MAINWYGISRAWLLIRRSRVLIGSAWVWFRRSGMTIALSACRHCRTGSLSLSSGVNWVKYTCWHRRAWVLFRQSGVTIVKYGCRHRTRGCCFYSRRCISTCMVSAQQCVGVDSAVGCESGRVWLSIQRKASVSQNRCWLAVVLAGTMGWRGLNVFGRSGQSHSFLVVLQVCRRQHSINADRARSARS